MNRRTFLNSALASSAVLLGGSTDVLAYNPKYKIPKFPYWYIDRRFGAREREILEGGLALFQERFLQNYGPTGETKDGDTVTWSSTYHSVTDEHAGDFKSSVSRSKMFYSDWLDMWQHFVHNEKPFPSITLKYKNVPKGGFVAQAPLDEILIKDYPNSTTHKGEFKIYINDWYVNNGDYSWSDSADYWAGTIAHEAWHNLGHQHPSSRTSRTYYWHQLIIHEMCVMLDRSVRYGSEHDTPVRCSRLQ